MSSGVAVLATASMLFCASAFLISKFQPSERVQLDLHSYAWLGNLHLKLEQPKPEQLKKEEPTLAVVIAPKSEQRSVQAAIPPAPKLKKFTPKKLLAVKPPRRERDELRSTAAVPMQEPAARLVLTEAQRMQQMHLFLRARLVASVRPELGVDPVRVSGMTIQQPAPIVPTQKRITPRKKTQVVRVAKRELPAKSVLREVPPVRVADPVLALAQLSEALKRELAIQPQASPIQEIKLQASSEVPVLPIIAAAPPAVPPLPLIKVEKAEPPVPAKVEVAQVTPDLESIRARLSEVIGKSSEPVVMATQEPLASQGADQLAVSQSQRVVPPAPEYSASSGYSCSALLKEERTLPEPALPKEQRFIEAFEWQNELFTAASEMVTVEGQGSSGTDTPGWQLTRAPGYWATLSRRIVSKVPLISVNSAKMLALTTGAQLEGHAGIVFGKLADGWSVSFSGRSERMILLDEENKPVADGSREGARYFVLMNAAPGAHLLHLTSRCDETGAVGIMVLPGTATYVDLARVQKTSLRGHLFQAGAADARPVKKAAVRVVGGSPRARTVTDGNGGFVIGDVIVVGDYPVFIESEARDQFVHRYERAPARLSDVTLFRFDNAQVDGWIAQLQGGISPESGLILALAPREVMEAQAGSPLFARIESLAAVATLEPETYAISPSGQLQPGVALDAESPRIMGVQVSEGPTLLSVDGQDQRVVWSRMTVTSRGVISVIGPN
ncbi:MAG: hypothetical protein NDJ90_07690 [Oligoflexia bacterium]|nr:hypothetical protein [Oligoflexia bacterium]